MPHRSATQNDIGHVFNGICEASHSIECSRFFMTGKQWSLLPTLISSWVYDSIKKAKNEEIEACL